MRFAERLLAARKARKWTQAELARRTGLAPAAICHYERGEREPGIVNLGKLGRAFGCTSKTLLGW